MSCQRQNNLPLSTDKKPGYFLPPFPLLDPLLYCLPRRTTCFPHRPLQSPSEISFAHLSHHYRFAALLNLLPGGPMGPGAPRGPGRPAMMVSMTVEASWGSPSGLKSRAEQLVSLQQELPSPSRPDFSPKSFGACCWPRSGSASGCKTWALGAITLCSLRAQAASFRPAGLLIPPLITPEKLSFLSKNWSSCTPI